VRRALLALALALCIPLTARAEGPSAVDWRAHLGPARNQSFAKVGCAAFATTAVLEAMVSIETGRRVTLREDGPTYQAAHREAVPQNVAALRAALQHGPVYAVLRMMNDFPLYQSGVYEWRHGGSQGCHSVALVGYQDVEGKYGGGWFIARNSSGAAWGEDGHIRIGYSQVANEVALGMGAYRYWGMVPPSAAAETWFLPWVRRYGA
jgi:hypothetical protein